MQTRGSLLAKNRRSILVAIFTIYLARFNRCSACPVASAAIVGRALSRSTLLCTSGCRAYRHRRWPSNPMALSTQCPVIRAAAAAIGRRRAVGNTVNTRGDRRRDSCADHLMYGDVHSPGKRHLCSLCRRR